MTEPDIIARIRRVLTEAQWQEVAPGVPMDATTAKAIVTVYDALSAESRAKFAAMSPVRMAVIAWKLIGRNA